VHCVQVYEFQVSRNDVLVLGSDGIFDNLFDGQIVAVVTAVQKAGGGPEVVITIVLFQLPVFAVMICFSDCQRQVHGHQTFYSSCFPLKIHHQFQKNLCGIKSRVVQFCCCLAIVCIHFDSSNSLSQRGVELH
jgi:hypothetical protein